MADLNCSESRVPRRRLLHLAASAPALPAVSRIAGAHPSDAAHHYDRTVTARCAEIATYLTPAQKGRVVVLDDFPEIGRAKDIAPALAATAAGIADGVISVDEAAAAANVLQKFLDVLETAHRLRRGLSLVDDGNQ